ncbi:MAG: hypothetical protein AB8I08_27550 [Sandaracinaceae bacterium]
MTLGHEYNAMTGLERDSCHWLAYRYEDEEVGFRPEQGESWIGFSRGTQLNSSYGQRGWITGLYQTDSKVWASESAGRVYMNPALGLSKPWQTFQLEGVLRGVYGLSDDSVFTWGLHRGKPVAYHYDGSEWRPVATTGHIVGMHGASPDLIFAVGQKGYVARWNGSDAFEPMSSAATGTLSDVHVESADEIYACGPDGELVQGTTHGWEPVLRHELALHCITRWRDVVWVGGLDGLFKLEDDKLVVAKDNLKPIRFDARGELLITQPTYLVSTLDGVAFSGIPLLTFSQVAASRPPAWR